MFFRIAVVYIFRDYLKLGRNLFDPQPPPGTPPPRSLFASPIQDGSGRVVTFRP